MSEFRKQHARSSQIESRNGLAPVVRLGVHLINIRLHEYRNLREK